MPTKDQVERDGYALIHDCVSEKSIQALAQALDTEQHGIRNLLSNPIVRELAGSDQLRSHVVPVLGEGCFAVRGVFFNKSPKANWKVSWHQDCVIAVREKLDIEDWGPWSSKADVIHVRPTFAVLQQMLSIRIHMDDCGDDNGALKVIPGSHRDGILLDNEIRNQSKNIAVACAAFRGDAVLMRPLMFHPSSLTT
jgi:hypothetical protein